MIVVNVSTSSRVMFYKNMAGNVVYIELRCHNEILPRCYDYNTYYVKKNLFQPVSFKNVSSGNNHFAWNSFLPMVYIPIT